MVALLLLEPLVWTLDSLGCVTGLTVALDDLAIVLNVFESEGGLPLDDVID